MGYVFSLYGVRVVYLKFLGRSASRTLWLSGSRSKDFRVLLISLMPPRCELWNSSTVFCSDSSCFSTLGGGFELSGYWSRLTASDLGLFSSGMM